MLTMSMTPGHWAYLLVAFAAAVLVIGAGMMVAGYQLGWDACDRELLDLEARPARVTRPPLARLADPAPLPGETDPFAAVPPVWSDIKAQHDALERETMRLWREAQRLIGPVP